MEKDAGALISLFNHFLFFTFFTFDFSPDSAEEIEKRHEYQMETHPSRCVEQRSDAVTLCGHVHTYLPHNENIDDFTILAVQNAHESVDFSNVQRYRECYVPFLSHLHASILFFSFPQANSRKRAATPVTFMQGIRRGHPTERRQMRHRHLSAAPG